MLRKIKEQSPETLVILMTAFSTVENAVEAMKLGAYHYVNKPFNLDEVAMLVEKALETSQLRREVRALRSSQSQEYSFESIIGIEETLRWAGPVGTSTRQTTETTELSGVKLEEGALIGAVLSSANRDPRRFADPDRFDVHRKEGAHLAFAVGNHFCLGAWFGRHLARVSLEILLDRLPGLRLDPERPATLSGWEFRAPDSTWVRWDRGEPRGPARSP